MRSTIYILKSGAGNASLTHHGGDRWALRGIYVLHRGGRLVEHGVTIELTTEQVKRIVEHAIPELA